MFNPESLRNIIRIALKPITASRHPLWSPAAEEILLMIAAHESGLGTHLRQLGGGPGRGLYQIEPDTLSDNYDNFIEAPLRRDLRRQIAEISGVSGPDLGHLQFNPIYGTIHARLKLYRSPGQLPDAHDVQGMAAYAKLHYNSPAGAATEEKYLQDYFRLVLV